MLGWIARLFLVIAGFITSIFVSKEALNYTVIQMVIAVLLFTITVIVAAFWPGIKRWFDRIRQKNK